MRFVVFGHEAVRSSGLMSKIEAVGKMQKSQPTRNGVMVDKPLPVEDLSPNTKTIAAMKQARQGKLKRFADVETLMRDLKASD
jgi:hypothetical protein